jgi:Holliday junction resolvase RusA-like endonuclease
MTQRSKFKSKQAQRYLDYKTQIGWTAKAAGAQPSHAPFQVTATAYIKSPDMDVDNLAKSFMDGLNKIAWHDDRQVILLHIKKIYVDKPEDERAEIEIEEATIHG